MVHDADAVGHDAFFVQTGVTIEDDIVSVLQVTVDFGAVGQL